mmetsp:Transcript_24065/g.39430  ORF Transcript_24065/g.39430 Transcript_24065/m.39430 type:complete len:143 (-) Transcript_24065:187-615(-)
MLGVRVPAFLNMSTRAVMARSQLHNLSMQTTMTSTAMGGSAAEKVPHFLEMPAPSRLFANKEREDVRPDTKQSGCLNCMGCSKGVAMQLQFFAHRLIEDPTLASRIAKMPDKAQALKLILEAARGLPSPARKTTLAARPLAL